MHELSIAQSIVDSVLAHQKQHGGRRVTTIGVRVGEVSGVNAEALEFCFGATIEDTPLAGAALALERVAVRYRCHDCGHEFEPVEFNPACPACASIVTAMIAGDELALAYLELEDEA